MSQLMRVITKTDQLDKTVSLQYPLTGSCYICTSFASTEISTSSGLLENAFRHSTNEIRWEK